MESTYGDRTREEEGDRTGRLFQIIDRAIRRKGKVIIPSFAVGRTQEVLTRINDLVEGGRLPGLRVFVDSPMAVAATKAFALHPEAYSKSARELVEDGDSPLQFEGLQLITSVEESIALNRSNEPAVIHLGVWDVHGRSRQASPQTHHFRLAQHDTLRGLSGRAFTGTGHPIGNLPHPDLWGLVPTRGPAWRRSKGSRLMLTSMSSSNGFASLDGPPRRTFVVHGEEKVSVELCSDTEETLPRRCDRFRSWASTLRCPNGRQSLVVGRLSSER